MNFLKAHLKEAGMLMCFPSEVLWLLINSYWRETGRGRTTVNTHSPAHSCKQNQQEGQLEQAYSSVGKGFFSFPYPPCFII